MPGKEGDKESPEGNPQEPEASYQGCVSGLRHYHVPHRQSIKALEVGQAKAQLTSPTM